MASNPAIALWLQSLRPVGRVAELGSFFFQPKCVCTNGLPLVLRSIASSFDSSVSFARLFPQNSASRLAPRSHYSLTGPESFPLRS